MLYKYIMCLTVAAAVFPAYAQTAPQTADTEQSVQSAPDELAKAISLPEDLVKSNPALAAELKNELLNNRYMNSSDIPVLIAQKTGHDGRISSQLKEKYAKDTRLRKYETQMVYRQVAADKKMFENKASAIAALSRGHDYTPEQAQKASDLYQADGGKPVEYNLPSNNELNELKENPVEMMQQLSLTGRLNQAYDPASLDKFSDLDDLVKVSVEQQSHSVTEEQEPQKTAEAPETPKSPILSVQTIRRAQPQVVVVKKPKRLGVKSYGIDPDNFY